MEDDVHPEELGIRLDWPEDPLEAAMPAPEPREVRPTPAEFAPTDDFEPATEPDEPVSPATADPAPVVSPEPFAYAYPDEPEPVQADLAPVVGRLDALISSSLAFQRIMSEQLADYAGQVARLSTSAVGEFGDFRVSQEGLRAGMRADIEEYRRAQDAALAEVRSGVEEIGAAMRRLVATTLDISSELGSLVVATRQASTQMGSLVTDVEGLVRRLDSDLRRTISESEAQQASQRRDLAAVRDEMAAVHDELKGLRRRLPVATRAKPDAADAPVEGRMVREQEADPAIAEARAARDVSPREAPDDTVAPRRRRRT